MSVDRRGFLQYFAATGLSSTLFPGALYAIHNNKQPATVRSAANTPVVNPSAFNSSTHIGSEETGDWQPITVEEIAQAEKIAGLSFTAEERTLMLEDLNDRLASFQSMRKEALPNSVAPAIQFDLRAVGVYPPEGAVNRLTNWTPERVTRPDTDEELAFMSVAELASLIKSRQVTSLALTQLYLRRLKQYDEVLEAVVTLTEERALAQAVAMDKELDAGAWRGPLHGIPWGAKDLLSVAGYPTTWGAMPFKDQQIEEDAVVVKRLDDAGAVLVAKLTLGALAWGDVWYDGVTKNPWNIEQGSSGSSAGPGSAVAAGLVGFAIGSETLGSIVSPSTRNGITGLRPTFGRVSRHGAMALSWSMDKLGPMCRSAQDCALVFDAIHGEDRLDPTAVNAPFNWQSQVDIATLRVGYIETAFEGIYNGKKADDATLAVLRDMGVKLQSLALPQREVDPLLLTLNVEAGAAFDGITRNREIDSMVRQIRRAWPNSFRASRFVPAVEYIQANRYRTLLMREMEEMMQGIDVFVAPSFRGGALQITNLTGHPAVVVPNRFDKLTDNPGSPRRSPGSITFTGGLYKDDAVLAVAHAYQQQTDFHLRRPPIA